MQIQIPAFVKKGDTIGVTAPSFGCTIEPYITRFESAVKKFNSKGFNVKVGNCVHKSDGIGISSLPEACAEELVTFYNDDENAALISAGGGELMCETISNINFKKLQKSAPKWFMGYSDNTNFIFPLVTCTHVAAIYGHNFPGFGKVWEQSEKDNFAILNGTKTMFNGYKNFQTDEDANRIKDTDYLSPYLLSCKKEIISTHSKFTAEGIMLGGCLDILTNLCGTKFDCMKEFIKGTDKIIWVLEACDLSPLDIRRTLWHLDESGWFKNACAFIFGRPLRAWNQSVMGVNQYNAVTDILSKYNKPIAFDCDIGHLSPTLPVVFGVETKLSIDSNLHIEYKL